MSRVGLAKRMPSDVSFRGKGQAETCSAQFRVVPGDEFQPTAQKTSPASRQRQAQPDAPLGMRVRLATSAKWFEYRACFGAIDAGPGVRHIQMNIAVFTA